MNHAPAKPSRGAALPNLGPTEVRKLVTLADDLIRDLRHEIVGLRGAQAGLKTALAHHQERIDELLSALDEIRSLATGNLVAGRIHEIAVRAMAGAWVPPQPAQQTEATG